jgi:CubicO group peptidase (beta-lactamase class C family)
MPVACRAVSVIAAVDGWPVDHAAAAVVARSGDVLAVHGDTTRSFAWASVTKLVTALATLVAVEEGTVALDEHLRRLLSHAPAEAGRRRYSNEGYDEIAALVAGAAGMPFASYAREAVVEPLGMTGADVSGSPAAGATGTIDDLAALGRELLAPTIVSPATLLDATSVQFPGLAGVLPGFGRQDPNDWGLGFELRDHKSPHWTGARNSPSTFGHFGQTGTFLWVDPDAGDRGVALAVLTDREFGDWAKAAWPALSDSVVGQAGATASTARR